MVGALRGGSRALPVARISDINRIATPVRFNPLERFKACQLRSEVGDTVESKVDLQRTLGWIGAAGVFSLGIALTKGSTSAVEFLAGYVLEQSLSVDNLFVFLVLFDYFGVDSKQEEKILNYGILGAILLRGIFIALGSVALENFHQVLLVFAGILFYSAYKIVFAEDDGEEEVLVYLVYALFLYHICIDS